jgi:hypothetical protein
VLRTGRIQGEGSVVYNVQTKLEPPPIGASGALKIVKNGLELRKFLPSKVEGSRTQKQTIKHYKVNSQTLKKFLL